MLNFESEGFLMPLDFLHAKLYRCTLIELPFEPHTDGQSHGEQEVTSGLCTLLIALNDGICLYTNHIRLDLRQGSCVLIPPDQSYRAEAFGGQAKLMSFVFAAYEVKELRLQPVALPPLMPSSPYSLPWSQIKQALGSSDWPAELNCDVMPTAELTMLQARLLLILGMMAQLEQEALPLQQETAIARTLEYMEQHFDEALTVEDMARMAGMVRWQYSRAFKAATGKKPTDYLAELRVRHAKSLLASSKEPLREISRQVGFKDEYYFSRRFTQLTGSSPRAYAKLHIHAGKRTMTDSLGRRIHVPEGATRIVATGTNTLGELLTLGINPVGAGLSTMKSQVVYKHKLHGIADVGLRATPDQVSSLEPELMLLGNFCAAQLPELHAIAPAAALRVKGGTYASLRMIAEWVNRGQAAERWITRYEAGVRRLRRQLVGQYTAGEDATTYLKLGSRLYIMGQSGFAATLYESLGFSPSVPAQRLIEEDIPWMEIRPDEISRYAGERNFLLAPGQELRTAAASGCRLLQAFAGLTPGKLHLVEASWNYDDPITRGRLLAKLPVIFSRTGMTR
jgi:AraC-like DNA-binding protein